MTIQYEVNCRTCQYRDHSGAFTPGGAKNICGHSDAARSFYPFDAKAFKDSQHLHTSPEIEAAFPGDTPETTDPYHWKFRIIDVSNSEPPAQCPLRRYKVGLPNVV